MLRLPAPFAPRFVSFAWCYRSGCRLVRSFADVGQPYVCRPGHWVRLPFCRFSGRRRQGLPRSWGTHMCVRRVLRPRWNRPHQAILRCGDAAPIDSQSKGFHVEQFRGSIARPSHSLSTLRTADYSNGTQDSLPAAGQLYRTGIAPAGFLRKVSEIRHFFLPPFPRLRGARLTCYCPFGAKLQT